MEVINLYFNVFFMKVEYIGFANIPTNIAKSKV